MAVDCARVRQPLKKFHSAYDNQQLCVNDREVRAPSCRTRVVWSQKYHGTTMVISWFIPYATTMVKLAPLESPW